MRKDNPNVHVFQTKTDVTQSLIDSSEKNMATQG